MDIADIVTAAGGASKLAKLVGCHHSTILGWKRVPVSRLEVVAQATGIPVQQLRPDLARLFGPATPPTTDAAA